MGRHSKVEEEQACWVAWPLPGPHRPLHDRETIIKSWRIPVRVKELVELGNSDGQ